MLQNKRLILLIILFVLIQTVGYPQYALDRTSEWYEECTVGVAAGSATSDGRPLVWKTRDATAYNNEVYFNELNDHHFISVISAGVTSNSWMGVNDAGFAIINSYAPDLPGGTSGYHNGNIMYHALATCSSIADFESLLTTTNSTGRQTQANFGVIDSSGGAAIFETSGNAFWKYDANDTLQAPNGYVLRTNFALNGGGSGGIERYRRTQDIFTDLLAGDSINHRNILRTQMRDFSNYNSDPLSVPFADTWDPYRFGYIDTRVSICRSSTVSTAVIHGVLPEEDPRLSTMWVILGQPSEGIAVPYWPVGATPAAANGDQTAPLCDVANMLWYHVYDLGMDFWYLANTYKLIDDYGTGLWTKIFPAEDHILETTADSLEAWRADSLRISEILAFEATMAENALGVLNVALDSLDGAMKTEINQPYLTPGTDSLLIISEMIDLPERDYGVKAIITNGFKDTSQVIILNDSGNEPDSQADDGFWCAHSQSFQDEDFFDVQIKTHDLLSGSIRTFTDAAHFTTAGPIEFDGIVAMSDTINASGEYGIMIALRNVGTSATVNNVVGTLVTEHAAVSRCGPDWVSYGNLSPGESKEVNFAYWFDVADPYPGPTEIPFEIRILSNNRHFWTDSFTVSTVVATDALAGLPSDFHLGQNYPNPFNPRTTMRYALPEDSYVNVYIYDVTGRLIKILADRHQPAGFYDIEWSGIDNSGNPVSTGVYFCRLQAGDYNKTIKMVYLR